MPMDQQCSWNIQYILASVWPQQSMTTHLPHLRIAEDHIFLQNQASRRELLQCRKETNNGDDGDCGSYKAFIYLRYLRTDFLPRNRRLSGIYVTLKLISASSAASGTTQLMYTENTEKTFSEGSGCCAVERAAISNTREPGFESSHGQLYSTFIYCCLNVEKYQEKRRKDETWIEKYVVCWIWNCGFLSQSSIADSIQWHSNLTPSIFQFIILRGSPLTFNNVYFKCC